jgi:predicted metal-dependent hydrolase
VRKQENRVDLTHVTIEGELFALSLYRSRQRKRSIAFKMESDTSLRVTAPFSTSLHSITQILQKRSAWIKSEKAARQNSSYGADLSQGSAFSYLGHKYKLHITQGNPQSSFCRLQPHILNIHIPDDTLSSEALGQEVRLEILLWMKKRARIKFKKRLDLWAHRMGVHYKKLMVTDPEQRWGSCSRDNIIRLNWRLMMAPLSVLDYVVAHELAHIPHKDHSLRFWAFLSKEMPDYKERRKILRSIEKRLMV